MWLWDSVLIRSWFSILKYCQWQADPQGGGSDGGNTFRDACLYLTLRRCSYKLCLSLGVRRCGQGRRGQLEGLWQPAGSAGLPPTPHCRGRLAASPPHLVLSRGRKNWALRGLGICAAPALRPPTVPSDLPRLLVTGGRRDLTGKG